MPIRSHLPKLIIPVALIAMVLPARLSASDIASFFGPNIAAGKKCTQSSVSAQWSQYQDKNKEAQGGVDGPKTGKFGFHTDNNDKDGAWWQVDLGREVRLGAIMIYNRQDCCSDRADSLKVKVSSDGKNWTTQWDNQSKAANDYYRGGGHTFGGIKGDNPLTIEVFGEYSARYVRLQINPGNYLHLDKVEICEYSDDMDNRQ